MSIHALAPFPLILVLLLFFLFFAFPTVFFSSCHTSALLSLEGASCARLVPRIEAPASLFPFPFRDRGQVEKSIFFFFMILK
jgi:hypothetical protein